MKKQFVTVCLVLLISLALFANGKEEAAPKGTISEAGTLKESTFTGYPMAPGKTLSYWITPGSTLSANFSSMSDTPYAEEFTKQTGITIDYKHPPLGQETEQFSLIMADGEYPDIMFYNWLSRYPGGPEKAIADGVIYSLNDIFEKYCPNISAYLAANPDIARMLKTDEGHYYSFPLINSKGSGNYLGPMVRSDLLEKFGLETPTTIDDWYHMLKVMKQNGIEYPLTAAYSRSNDIALYVPFMYANHVESKFYVGDDDIVHYGPIEDGFKNYLKTFAKWYSEGLIDPDLPSLTTDQVAAKMTSGKSAATWSFRGSRMGSWIPAGQATNPDYMLKAVPWPTLDNSENPPEYGFAAGLFDGLGAAITTSCTDIERAARALDYSFGKEGHMLATFGIEGESYTLDADGEPQYTDTILKNEKGWTPGQALSAYTITNFSTPLVKDLRYVQQYSVYESQKESTTMWISNCDKHNLPPLTPSPEDSKTIARIMNEVYTYANEMTLKFILGNKDIEENWNEYVQNVHKMGIDTALEIENKAYASYKLR
jgi:putative aldouronate transport system substrate-binding protein